MGRRAQVPAEIPTCPRGHEVTEVVRAGTYGHGPKVRQLWWCRPVDGTAPHRFSERLPRTLLDARDPHSCVECETKLAVHEGPQHPRQYEFAARVIAQAMVAVGSGVSYVHAARTARVAAGVGKSWDAQFRKHPNRVGANGTMVADWVGSLTEVVTGPVFDAERWPTVVALDEIWFGKSIRQPGRRQQRETNWVVWGAYAHPESGRRGHLFRLGASGELNAKAAAAWLRSIPGRPTDIVCDGTKLWPKAVSLAWPRVVDEATGEILAEEPTIWPCRFHLAEELRKKLREASVLAPRDAPARYRPKMVPTSTGHRKALRVRAQEPDWYTQHRVALRSYDDEENHPLVVAAGRALYSQEDWDHCLELARKWQANTVASWMVKNVAVREDLATRPAHIPKSIGALEGVQRRVKMNIKDRAKLLRNTVRTQRLMDLMTLHLRNLDQVDAYATRIRAHLEAHDGLAPQQRVGVTGGAHMY